LEIRDVHFNRGPFGKLHVRLGKGARGSGPRPRWVPMLDRLDDLLRWYLADARPGFREKGPVLFCDESGGVMAFGTIRNRLAYLQQLEGGPVDERFSCGVSELLIERPTFPHQASGLWRAVLVGVRSELRSGLRAGFRRRPCRRATPSKAPLFPRGGTAGSVLGMVLIACWLDSA